MTIREFFDNGIGLLQVCGVYYVIQLVRCVLASFPVFASVFLLRKTLLKNRVFLKGALWCWFLPVLFVGKMKFFYENAIAVKLFYWCTEICLRQVWICWLYLSGVFIAAALLFYRRKKLKRLTAGMEQRMVEGTVVYVTEMPVTPATIGLFRPKIVIPEVIWNEYDREELQTILLHEKTHIRLGHLLFYFLWDLLRALLWVNPFLSIGTKFFREDMEEICDVATIRRSGKTAYAYGQLLLKSMRVLKEEEGFHMFAAFSGDKNYRNIRERITRIARYKPYKRGFAVSALAVVLLCVTGTIVWIQTVSYDRANENDVLFAYGFDGENVTFLDNSAVLHQMIFYDDEYVYVKREEFEKYMNENQWKGDIFIVFGGFYKLPGVGGCGCACFYEPGSKERIVKFSYENPMDDWKMRLLKML